MEQDKFNQQREQGRAMEQDKFNQQADLIVAFVSGIGFMLVLDMMVTELLRY